MRGLLTWWRSRPKFDGSEKFVPSVEEQQFPPWKPNCGVFVKLKNSERNCNLALSRMRKSLIMEKSQSCPPGQRMWGSVRGAVPSPKAGGVAKQLVSKYASSRLSTGPLFTPLQILSGRPPARKRL